MAFTAYTMELDEITQHANIVRELLFQKLEAAGCILPETAKRWTVVAHKKGTLGTALDKLFGRNSDEGVFYYSVLEEK